VLERSRLRADLELDAMICTKSAAPAVPTGVALNRTPSCVQAAGTAAVNA